MAIKKNTAPEAPVAKATTKTPPKAVATKAAAPAAKAATKAKAPAVPVAKESPAQALAAPAPAVRVVRKELAASLRQKIIANGAAIPLKVAEMAVTLYEEVITEALVAGKQVALPGFGSFSSVAKAASNRPNPRKPGEFVTIEAHNAPKFKAGAKLKAAVNGGIADEAGSDE